MVGKFETALGEIAIDEDVIARIVATVASGCYGVVGMAYRSTVDGVASLLKGETGNKGVKISVDENNELTISLHIVTQYGLNINAICESIVHNVKYQVTSMTGFTVKQAHVHVESIRANN
ncbi:MAG: Asp23/Gls24 family envelope stress response protein [Bacillota bacterium]|nr:Asp23/Gls24 family envelope stress response protein [Bacillota bacterium]